MPEVQILLYAVGASKFLTEKKATVLTEKIAELLGNIQANRVKELLTKKRWGIRKRADLLQHK